jgi:hypothetical protein
MSLRRLGWTTAGAHRIQPEIDKPAADTAASLRRALRR